MALLTTTVGAFPKPPYVPLPDWFSASTTDTTKAANSVEDSTTVDAAVARGIAEVVGDQVAAGIDVPTDGEVRRENYVHHHCRHLGGFDFEHLTRRTVRDGSWEAEVPTVVGPVTAGEPFLVTDYELAQASTGRPVKMTVPGPMTIIDSTANAYYQSEPDLGAALATAINAEIRALVAAGCTQIQIDEPVMARYPQPAANYGFDLLAMALAGLDGNVTATIHICCGYPDRLDAVDYPKADPAAYAALLPLVETSRADVVSLEDAHRNNPLGIFESLKTTTVALGAVDIARSGVEATDAIADRVAEVLEVVDADRLMLAPDCGLGYLSRQVSIAKLRSMTAAARRF